MSPKHNRPGQGAAAIAAGRPVDQFHLTTITPDFQTPTQADLLAAMSQEPELTDFGLGVYEERRLSPEERAATFEAERRSLANNLEHFRICVGWLRGRTRDECVTSYGLKHRVEHDIPRTYVTNGAMIAALIHCGVPYVKPYGCPNVTVQWRKYQRLLRERA